MFPSLLKRNRLFTVPVYDYVLMTEPLSAEQLAAIGWTNRQGLADLANQFHYYRLSADNRILWGGYDALYHFGRAVKNEYEDNPATFRKLASHFFTTFPQLEGVKFSHRWAGAIDTSTRFCAFFGTAHGGRVGLRHRVHRARGGGHALCRQGDARPAGGPGHRTDPAENGALQTVAVPAGALRLGGDPGHPLVAEPCRPQRRQTKPAPENPRRRWPRLRFLTSFTEEQATHGDTTFSPRPTMPAARTSARVRDRCSCAASSKNYGSATAVAGVDLDVHSGEFLSLLGPSGCGKTTLLRMIAGFEEPDEGEILLAGASVVGVPPNKRPINTVFQAYALFPHMSVAENVAYGLRQKRTPKAEVAARVSEALGLVQMSKFANRNPQTALRRPAAARGPGPGHRQPPQGAAAR